MSSKNNSLASIPPANLTHKAFEVVQFVDKLPLTIECMACYDNIFILGTSTGRILIYEVRLNPILEASFEKSINITKKPIQQIEVIKEFEILIVLFDYQIHVLDLEKFQLQYSIGKTKNCSLFATSVSKDKKLLRLVVACKRKLQFFYLSNQINSKFMELISDLELNDTPRTLELTRDNLVIFSLRKDFYYYILPSNSASLNSSNDQLEFKFNSGSRSLDSLCYKLNNDNFLIGYDDNKTILYDAKGVPGLKYSVEWSSSPLLVCNCGFYLLGILPNSNTVEVLVYQPKSTSVQLIELTREMSGNSSNLSSGLSTSLSQSFTSKIAPIMDNVPFGLGGLGSNANSPDKLKLLKSNGNSICYVANQSNVWCLTPIKMNEQIESTIRLKNYDLGLYLISAQNLFNESKVQENPIDKPTQLKPFFSLKYLELNLDESLIRKLKNFHALELFIRRKFSDSFHLFQEMKTDPSHLIAFFPGLLPDGYRSKLNLDEFYQNFDPKELEDAIAGLIDYLQFKRNEFLKLADKDFLLIPLVDGRPVIKKKIQVLEIIDTTLLKCYLKSKENLVQFFLRRDPNFLHLDESERLLNQHNKLNELIILYEKKEAHEKALNLLLAESSKSNSNLSGLKHLVEYMKKLGSKRPDLVFKYAKSVLETDYKWGLKIFIGGDFEKVDKILEQKTNEKSAKKIDTENSRAIHNTLLSAFLKLDITDIRNNTKGKNPQQLDFSDCIDDDDDFLKEHDHTAIFKFFDEQIEPKELSSFLVRIYLQYCIYVWNVKSSSLNNNLIDVYKDFIEKNHIVQGQIYDVDKPKIYKQMLKYFLNQTNFYEPLYALSKLDLDNYPEERAVVLGKIGKHQEALSIYVNILNDTDKAEAYCEYIYSQPEIAGSKQVFYELLQLYLNSDYEEIRIDASIRLLNAHSNEIGTVRTLELLPAQLMKCKNLSQFFENMLDRLVRTKHDTKIRNRLMVALQLQIHENKILCQDKKFVVTDEQMCKECNKRMGKSAMVRYPNGVLIHYGCLKNSEAHMLKNSNS
ncbi:unnamed protein product [Brachionus calyciflorus]|uniref:CNH domain-containing protein n=1 Tax=Brachionus calyciflorus TaxID=104777 RepID=A0A813S4X7_9BILA|nr:unnamed protein product [Brachionus calyciflorus]